MTDNKPKKPDPAKSPPNAATGAAAEAGQSSDKKIDDKDPKARPPEEIGGRDGLDPTRYGDWENKGILSDF